MRNRGMVKFYSREKHFGFIRSTDGGDVYVGGIEARDIEHELKKGAVVEFDIAVAIGGKSRAIDISVILAPDEVIED